MQTSNNFPIETVHESEVVYLVNGIFEAALHHGASDIHIEPQEQYLNIRFRVSGEFVHYKNFSLEGRGLLKRRIKLLGGLKLDQSRLPQDGKTSANFGNEHVEFRISTFPVVHGEKIVIRVLSDKLDKLDLQKLGFLEASLTRIKRTIEKSQGLVLCTGPTGAGKSTTLFSMIREYDASKVNIATLEDPVEYQVPGVNQSQMNPEIGLDFAEGLRSLMRQDVDVIMVGEIRDRKTVDLAVDAALTGHAVYSSIHANSAVATITRLQKMGMESFLLGSALRLIIAQRLAVKLCTHCRKKSEPSPSVMQSVQDSIGKFMKRPLTEVDFYEPVGCEKCSQTGHLGQVMISEVFEVTPEIETLIVEQASEADLEALAAEQNMLNLRQDALLRAIMGEISLAEAFKY